MEGVAGAFQVISLAIQLVETGQKISKFLASVQDAPSEVVKLGQTVDQLNGTLKQVSYLLEQQYLVQRLPGSSVFIRNALENCDKRIKALEQVIQKEKTTMNHRNRVHRSWAAIRFVSKKEDIHEIQTQLRDAETGLQTAMQGNLWQLQLHTIGVSKTSALQARTTEETLSARPINAVSRCERLNKSSSSLAGVFRTTAKETSLVWYRGFFGSVDIQSKSTYLNRSDSRRPGKKAISEEKIIRITPMFLHKTFELRFWNSFGHISRTLSTYHILENESPIFEMCMDGDIEGLQVILSSGHVSPFVLNEIGCSLLHYAAYNGNVEMCEFLLQLGIDSKREDFWGRKAIYYDQHMSIQSLRLLTQSQNDLSSLDIYQFWSGYGGPAEGAEFWFLQDLIPSTSDVSDGELIFPPLATALRGYGKDPEDPQWENFLRLLLRKEAGLHSPVPRSENIEDIGDQHDSVYPCKVLEYGTPLDELFCPTETPLKGEAAAGRWLQILSSEGYDVKDYLEEELALHAQQMQLTYPNTNWHFDRFWYNLYDVPRQLIYRWGRNPSVSWNWWIDPNSSTYLVREEFKYMDILGGDSHLRWTEWEELWPLRYPAWYDYDRYYWREEVSDLQSLYELAQERANRRLKKQAMKAARAQGFKKRNRMPGAWPV